MERKACRVVLALAVAGLAACGAAAGTDAGDVPGDEAQADAPGDEAADVPGDVPGDEAQGDVPADVPPGPGPCGFTLRVPGDGTDGARRIDHVCTFRHEGHEGCFYVQAAESTCVPMSGCEYVTDGFWTSFDGQVQAVAGATYDYGGNHHNDSVTFPLFEKVYQAYHSTFGFGWRMCQPMDCLQVLGPDGQTIEEDGCECLTRTLPIECVLVKADGTVDPFPDTFEPCNGPGCR